MRLGVELLQRRSQDALRDEEGDTCMVHEEEDTWIVHERRAQDALHDEEEDTWIVHERRAQDALHDALRDATHVLMCCMYSCTDW